MPQCTTIIQSLVFWEDFPENLSSSAASPGSGFGGIHPQVPLRFTWGYSWCHLYNDAPLQSII